jgi:hypothetical protein
MTEGRIVRDIEKTIPQLPACWALWGGLSIRAGRSIVSMPTHTAGCFYYTFHELARNQIVVFHLVFFSPPHEALVLSKGEHFDTCHTRTPAC